MNKAAFDTPLTKWHQGENSFKVGFAEPCYLKDLPALVKRKQSQKLERWKLNAREFFGLSASVGQTARTIWRISRTIKSVALNSKERERLNSEIPSPRLIRDL